MLVREGQNWGKITDKFRQNCDRKDHNLLTNRHVAGTRIMRERIASKMVGIGNSQIIEV
jgi:hypothetical protein